MRTVVVSLLLAGLALTGTSAVQQPRAAHGRLFPPEKLGELEGPDREEWQQPERIMDALAIADGSRVGDIGAGGGWFTVRLARRVGPHDFLATLYQHLGIDYHKTTIQDFNGRPTLLVDHGKAIPELCGLHF